jgi:peptidoglycan/xylan/chitin deacetylase (PgdA/CDA1 family)
MVIFRLDDVGFGSLNALLEIMDVFLMKNQSLSLGLVMGSVDRDAQLVKKIVCGRNRGIFELALHGWDHADYAELNEKEQGYSLLRSSQKMQNLFGLSSNTLIPPYNSFNNNTLRAMKNADIKIISSMLNYEDEKDIFRIKENSGNITNPNGIFHVPETASFEKWDRKGYPIRIPIKQILDNVNMSLWHYGYAVITLHPITFVKLRDGKSDGVVDESQIDDLRKLLESLESKDAVFTSFSKITLAD